MVTKIPNRSYVRAESIKVGNVFFSTDNYYSERRAQVVTGVGKATQTYGWRNHKTREVIKVATNEVIDYGWPLNAFIGSNRVFTFGPGDGVWIA